MKRLLVRMSVATAMLLAAAVTCYSQNPPFKQCSPSGYNCNILITVDRSGYLHVFTDPNLTYYPPGNTVNGSLIGFQNDSRTPVYGLSLTLKSGTGYPATHICSRYELGGVPGRIAPNVNIVNVPERWNMASPPWYYYNSAVGGIVPRDPYGASLLYSSCDIVFLGGIPKGGTTYFSLDGPAPNYPYWIPSIKDVVPYIVFQDILEKGKIATASVTLSQSPSPVPVTLKLAPTTGTGSAVFAATNSTTTTIDRSSPVEIRGVDLSSVAANIELSASVNDVKRVVNFTVTNLSCTSPVTRGQSITCQVNNGPAADSNYLWKFTDATGNVVTESNTSSTWEGIMVTSGTVSVTVEGIALAPADVTVNSRTNFAFTAVAPTQVMANSITCYDGTQHNLPSPPAPYSEEGRSCADMAYRFSFTGVNDGGPNNGYGYVTSVSPMSQDGTQATKFEYIVVSDLLDGGSTFFSSQCGDYSGANPNGRIAGSQLRQNVLDHEQGSVLSHWTEYRDAQNDTSNNIGAVLESVIGTPGMTDAQYKQAIQNAGNAALNRIAQAVFKEPCRTNDELNDSDVRKDSSQSCKFCGAINFAPYQSCGGSSPVPYCQ